MPTPPPVAWEVHFGRGETALFRERERAVQFAIGAHSHVIDLYELTAEQQAVLDRCPYGLLDDAH